MDRIKDIVFNLSLILLGLLSSFLVLEALLRLKPKSAPEFPFGYYDQNGGDAGYDIRENFPRTEALLLGDSGHFPIWSNELGCFDVAFPKNERSPERILVVGDSFTHSRLPYEDLWATRMENLCGIRVLKCGVTGYGVKQELLKAQKIISRTGVSPKLIVVGYFMNDLTDDYFWRLRSREADRNPTTAPMRIKDYRTGELVDTSPGRASGRVFQNLECWLYEHSAVYHDATESLRRLLSPLPEWLAWLPEDELPWLQRAWDDHLRNLKEFQLLAKKHGANLLVAIIPTKEQVYPYLPKEDSGNHYAIDDAEHPNKILRRYFDKEKIEYLDLLADFRERSDKTPRNRLDNRRDLYFRNDMHWTSKGQELASLLISRRIFEKRMIDVEYRDQRLKNIEEKLRHINYELHRR